MSTRHSIETAYSFLHQKRNVYIHSPYPWQRDDIEVAVADYADSMDPTLLAALAGTTTDYLRDHTRFLDDITHAVHTLEQML